MASVLVVKVVFLRLLTSTTTNLIRHLLASKLTRLTAQQRKVIAEEIIEHGSVINTFRQFQARYGTRLCKRTVQTNYAKWNVHGSVHNFNVGNSCHPKIARTLLFVLIRVFSLMVVMLNVKFSIK